MNFKKWVKSMQAAAYNGARTVDHLQPFVEKAELLAEGCEKSSVDL